MNILNINQNLSVVGGGITRRIRDFAPYLDKLGANVMALTSENIQELPRGIKNNIYLPELKNSRSREEDWIPIVRQSIINNKIDVCHIHEVANIKIIHYLIDRLPVVIHLHNYSWWCPGTQLFYASCDDICPLSVGWKCIPNAYTKRCNNRHPLTLFRSIADSFSKKSLWGQKVRFIAGSEYMKGRAAQAGIPTDKISVVSNGIDRSRFEGTPKKPDEPLEPGYLLYVGRLAKSKGMPYLLEAFSQLKYLDKKLVLVGDGYYKAEVQEYIKKLKLQDYVHLLGLKAGSELSWLYLNCSIVIFPSVWAEVFGNVGLEAMAASKPVIAFDVGGVSQWLQDNVTGFIVPRKDINRLADKIIQLIKNPNLADEMGKAGHESFLNHFTTEQQAKNLFKAYQLAVNNF